MRYLVVLSVSLLTAVASAQNTAAAGAQTNQARLQDSQNAGGILDAVKQAQNDLKSQNKDDAMKQIDRALDLQSKLDKSGPKGRMVPVFQETVSVAVYAPAKIAGAGQNANASSGTNEPNSADRMTTPAGKVAQDVVGESTRTFLDTSATAVDLHNAKDAVKSGDVNKAETALAAVQAAQITETVSGDEPLNTARQNLFLAGRQANRYLFQDAATSLNAAVKALENYANANGPHADGARVIGREITLYVQRMPQEPTQVAGQIQTWWDQIAAWTGTPQRTAQKQ